MSKAGPFGDPQAWEDQCATDAAYAPKEGEAEPAPPQQEPELDSPPFAPPELAALAARGFERVNRGEAAEPQPPAETEDRSRRASSEGGAMTERQSEMSVEESANDLYKRARGAIATSPGWSAKEAEALLDALLEKSNAHEREAWRQAEALRNALRKLYHLGLRPWFPFNKPTWEAWDAMMEEVETLLGVAPDAGL